MPSREPPERFPVSFYVVAMLFIMFDIEIIFLYPYAVTREALGVFGFVAILIFSALFFLTFVYEVARGGLDWGPLQRSRNLDVDARMVTPERTAATTIRRAGGACMVLRNKLNQDNMDSSVYANAIHSMTQF